MKLTNKKNLPEPIVRAVKSWAEEYDAGETWSATTLITPPWIDKLKAEYKPMVPPEDVVDLLYAFQGSFTHWMLEKQGLILQAMTKGWREKTVVEERLAADVEVDGEIQAVSAQLDLMEPNGVVTDYKETGVYKAKKALLGHPEPSWTEQLNIQAWLLRQHGYTPTKLQICIICRDWRKSEAMRDRDYPAQAELIPMDLWPEPVQLEFIKQRVRLRREVLIEGKEIPCIPEERWRQPTLYKVFRNKNKRACNGGTFLTDSPAKEFIHKQKNPKEYRIEVVAGMDRRCADYCQVSQFCKFNKEIKNS